MRGMVDIQCFLVIAGRTHQEGEFFAGSSRDPMDAIAMCAYIYYMHTLYTHKHINVNIYIYICMDSFKDRDSYMWIL